MGKMVDGPRPSQGLLRNWYARTTVLVVAGALVGAALFALTYGGVLNIGPHEDGSTMVTEFGHFDSAPLGLPELTAAPRDTSVANIVIPTLDVNAPVEAKGIDAYGVMESPDGPEDVVWYNFSAEPGLGGNAVFGGHVDYVDFGPAVFWGLRDLVQGDLIEVRLKSGTVYRYRVVASARVDADAGANDLGRVVGPTEQEVITLITCDGTFDPASQTYDQRLIVRAERITDNVWM
jgi:LPXTG-site transpeptidase (sortase) family protein